MDPSGVQAEAPVVSPTPALTLPASANTTIDTVNSTRRKHEDRAKRFGVEYVEPKLDTLNTPKRYINPKKSGFVTGFSLNDEAEKAKREMRAKKFGVIEQVVEEPSSVAPVADSSSAPVDSMDDGGMDVDLREERKDVTADIPRRLDTIYLYGTDDMSTQDVFKYFDGYGPESIEWINDSSCNIIFRDVHTTMRALQGLSKPVDEFNLQMSTSGAITTTPSSSVPATATTETSTTSTSEPAETTNESSATSPSPNVTNVQATPEQITLYGWRKGISVKGVPILLRYATVQDVKSKEFRPSAYYKKMLAQLRAKHTQTQKQQRNKNKNTNKKQNRRKERKQTNNDDNGQKSGKRKHDDGDVEMLDPAEQEKRLQRRRRFHPEAEGDEAPQELFIISSSTVPALLSSSLPPPIASIAPPSLPTPSEYDANDVL